MSYLSKSSPSGNRKAGFLLPAHLFSESFFLY